MSDKCYNCGKPKIEHDEKDYCPHQYRAGCSCPTCSKPTPPPGEQKGFPPMELMPFHECYILIEVDDDGEESASFFASAKERDDATLKAIWFDGPDECHKEEAEAYLQDLREKGSLFFEGDAPLHWRTMTDYVLQERSQNTALLAEAVREAKLSTLIGAQNMIMKEREDIAPSVYAHLYALLEEYIKAASTDGGKGGGNG